MTILLKQQPNPTIGSGHAIVFDLSQNIKDLISNAVQPTALTTALLDYVKTTDSSAYVTTTALTTALLDYVKTTALTTALSAYTKTSDLQTVIKDNTYSTTAIYPAIWDTTAKTIKTYSFDTNSTYLKLALNQQTNASIGTGKALYFDLSDAYKTAISYYVSTDINNTFTGTNTLNTITNLKSTSVYGNIHCVPNTDGFETGVG